MNELNLNWQQISDVTMAYLPNIVLAIVIFVLGRWFTKLLVYLFKLGCTRAKIDETLVGFLSNIVYALLLVIVVVASLDKLGVKTTSVVAILAAAGLAVGLALQGSLSNFASGVMLIIFAPFKKGDFVEVAGIAGKVVEVSVFVSTLHTPDNKVIYLPNAQITSGAITNYSREKKRRIDFKFGVSYEDDLKKVRKILEKIVAAESRILKDPEPIIAVSELADSSVNFIVRPWVKTEDYWAVFYDITEKVKVTFDKEKISIPYPQRDVHVFKPEIS